MKFKDWFSKEHSLPKNKTVSWRASAYGFIIKNKKILLIKSIFSNLWELPGGGVEINETIIKGLHREVFEETGYKIFVKNDQPLYVGDNNFYAPNVDKYFRAIPMVFLAELREKSQKYDWEVSGLKWFDLNKLPKEIGPLTVSAIQKYKQSK